MDEAFSFAVRSGGVGSGTAVFELHVLASCAEQVGAVAGAVVGKQSANADAVAGKEVDGRVQEADGGWPTPSTY